MSLAFRADLLWELAPRAHPSYREAFERHGTAALEAFGILENERRLAHFLGQILHESGGLRRTHENLNYSAEGLQKTWPRRFPSLEKAELVAGDPERIANAVYEGREDLGNIHSGDGYRFRGRGIIQLTGRSNYLRIGRHLDLDLVRNPELVVSPEYAVHVAGAFWELAGVNEAADRDDLHSVTKRINGALTGILDRRQWLEKVRKVYGFVVMREA